MDYLIRVIDNVDGIPEIENCTKSKAYLRQWVTATNFILAFMLAGLALGHTAILIQQINPTSMSAAKSIRIENGEIFGKAEIIVESKDLLSWIASVLVLFNLPGCWILALSSNRIGRKPILITSTGLFSIAWFIVVYSSDAYGLILGRSAMSLSTGVLAGLAAVYQGECYSSKLRSVLIAMQGLSFSVGILTCHVVGTWFHWRTTAFFCGCISFINLGLNLFIPESPIWLLNREKFVNAIHSWSFLHGTRDFNELKSMFVHRKAKSMEEDPQFCQDQQSMIKRFFTPAFLKPFGIMITLFTVKEFSGAGAVTFYCMQMISDIAGSGNTYVPTLILDVCRLLSSIALQLCIKFYSTRTLTLFSAFSCSLLLIALSLSTVFQVWTPWCPLIFLFGYEIAVILGLMVLPWNFLSEIFSPVHKDISIGVTTSYHYMLYFVIVKMNFYFNSVLQIWGTFLIYGCLTFGGSVVLYFILPNTKNKSLKEIEMLFSNDDKRKILKNQV